MDNTNAIACLAALAQDTRLDIVRYLVRKGLEGAPAGSIAEEFGLASATLTFHLNILVRAGVLTRQRSSRHIIYRADVGAVHSLSAFLLENCCSESATEKLGDSDKFNVA